MASESAMKPVNGNYGNQQQYGTAEEHLSSHSGANTTTSGAYDGENPNPMATNNSSSVASEGNGGVPKDEVGWYFVEQYYTTLSKNPEKLHVSLETQCYPPVSAKDCRTDNYLAFLLQTIPVRFGC